MNVAKLSLNLILFKFKVEINGLLCFLDLGATHSFCEPKCNNATQMGGHKGGQAHQGLIGTWNHNIDKQGCVGGCFGMRQCEVHGEHHGLCLGWH